MSADRINQLAEAAHRNILNAASAQGKKARDNFVAAAQSAVDALRAVALAVQPAQAVPPTPQKSESGKVLDDPRLQELFTSCIDGALTSGYQGVAVPPQGHWLAFWWKKGQAVAMVEEGARSAAQPAQAVQADAEDAARWQWLRENCQHGPYTIAKDGSWGLNPWGGDDPDKAVDAARAQPAQPGDQQ